jgi:hypothetical protein
MAISAVADSYSTFQTKRFYSANRRYFIEVRPNKRATLYHNRRTARRIWTRMLPELPRELFVSNDGLGAAMVDFYYGNNCVADAPVVVLFGRDGQELARHALKDLANLSRTTATTSMCYWFGDTKIAPDHHTLTIQTIVAKHDRSNCGNINSPDDADKMWEICMATMPYQNLTFDMVNGSLASRENVAER